MKSFLQALKVQRWDDHRYYHHSRINQSLHLISAISFLCAYALLFSDPAAAALIGWLVSMVSRQSGHFFFEPKGYDEINQATHEYKEEVKVGYNLRRKVVLMTIWAMSPLALFVDPTLGGVFASAMTGNFALLAYYVAQSDSQAAMGSVVALLGFAVGCAGGVLLRRGRAQEQALNLLLAGEAGLLLFFALYALWTPHMAHAPSDHLQILLLAVAMGLQAVIGQSISLTSIVFTQTLTKLVGTIADSIANGDVSGLKDVKIQSAVVVSYLFGALLSGALIVRKLEGVVVLPFIGVALALAMHRLSHRKPL